MCTARLDHMTALKEVLTKYWVAAIVEVLLPRQDINTSSLMPRGLEASRHSNQVLPQLSQNTNMLKYSIIPTRNFLNFSTSIICTTFRSQDILQLVGAKIQSRWLISWLITWTTCWQVTWKEQLNSKHSFKLNYNLSDHFTVGESLMRLRDRHIKKWNRVSWSLKHLVSLAS